MFVSTIRSITIKSKRKLIAKDKENIHLDIGCGTEFYMNVRKTELMFLELNSKAAAEQAIKNYKMRLLIAFFKNFY